jgi:hypothetical protein
MDGSCAADPDPEPSPSKPVFDLPGDPVGVEVAITEFLLDANHSVNRPIVETTSAEIEAQTPVRVDQTPVSPVTEPVVITNGDAAASSSDVHAFVSPADIAGEHPLDT